MKPTILFLFNSSTYAPAPWVDHGGFNVVSVDYDATDHSEAHRLDRGHHRMNVDLSQAQAKDVVMERLDLWKMAKPSLVVSFAPCTDLSVAGAKHFKSKLKNDPLCQQRALQMAKLASEFECAYMVENPISILSTLWKKPTAIINPCDFSGYIGPDEQPHPEFPGLIPDGDRYMKKTCLWAGNGFVLPVRDLREPLEMDNPGWKKLGGKSARTKYIRSLTPRGLSRAIFQANYQRILKETIDKPKESPILEQLTLI